MLPDCTRLPEWVGWVAQDADGTWWGYAHEPNMSDRGWYENELGDCIRLEKTEPNQNWKEQIYKT